MPDQLDLALLPQLLQCPRGHRAIQTQSVDNLAQTNSGLRALHRLQHLRLDLLAPATTAPTPEPQIDRAPRATEERPQSLHRAPIGFRIGERRFDSIGKGRYFCNRERVLSHMQT